MVVKSLSSESTSNSIPTTPMMKQYLDIKSKNQNCILLYRLGDFYEMFFQDAENASEILDIALTSREGGKGVKVPMCGIPYHAAEGYIEKLLNHGEKVAICEQVEDPKLAKGIVHREVTRVITPGTHIQSQTEGRFFLSAIYPFSDRFGLALMDISTGYFACVEFDTQEALVSELIKINPAECLYPDNSSLTEAIQNQLKNVLPQLMWTSVEGWKFDYEGCYRILSEHFEMLSLDELGLSSLTVSIVASGVVLLYAKDSLNRDVKHIQKLIPYSTHDYLIIDSMSAQKLELTESNGQKKNSLYWVLNQTMTPGGARLLKEWLIHPLVQVELIEQRQDAIADILEHHLIQELKERLKKIKDIEKIVSRIHCEYANARDLVALKTSLHQIPSIQKLMDRDFNIRLKDLVAQLDSLDDLQQLISQSIMDEPPLSVRDGGIIKDGIHEELDQLRALSQEGKNWILNFKAKEIERTGIKGLKISYNKVFGYYIEITHAQTQNVPSDYIRKQTLVNAERYITDELKDYEAKILGANERIKKIEAELFENIRKQVLVYTESLQKISASLSEIDVYTSLASVSDDYRFIRPIVDYGDLIDIREGRHPVVEKMHSSEKFIPNDTLMDGSENQIILITGPNMAGKSTYIRQVALLTIMAQIGSFIPCEEAQIGVVDRVFTRIGASDDLSQGQSTFMVEMTETAQILKQATSRSLIILDEIGRGTSTFDGISIAWSVVEYLHNHHECRAKTLFATHYHELTDLELTMNGVKNYNIAVREWNDEIVFLRKIVRGNADKSYGIHVARLAGLPKEVIERAKEVLACLEDSYVSEANLPKFVDQNPDDQDVQLSLFQSSQSVGNDQHVMLKKKLSTLNLDDMTPLKALEALYQLKEEMDI